MYYEPWSPQHICACSIMGETCIYVQVFIYIAIIVFAVIAADRDGKKLSCPGPLRYYKDLGCTPVYSTSDPCATRYDCDHVKERSRTKCYINDHEYNLSHRLRREDRNPCDEKCICYEGNKTKNEIAAFRCSDALSHCPKYSALPGCYFRYDPLKCCKDPFMTICSKGFSDRVDDLRAICIVNDQEYLDGDVFYVKEDPDLYCVCLPGYGGENVSPFCIKSNHSNCAHPAFNHTDFFGQKCAPIFINRQLEPNGCYNRMKCQHPNDQIIPYNNVESNLRSDEKNVCLFGNLIMQVGDRLEPFRNNTVDCIQCICEVPPVLTCEYLTANRLCNV